MSENKDWLRRDKFGNGIFWELYKDLERQFQTFLEYTPYLEGNENVYSFKLLNLILSIGDMLILRSKKWQDTKVLQIMPTARRFLHC